MEQLFACGAEAGEAFRGGHIIDADADTWIANFDFDNLTARDRHDLLVPGPGLPYVLRPGAKTLVIGPGGG